MRRKVLRFLQDESGPTAVEYAVMLAMILMAVLGVVGVVGGQAGGLWGDIETDLNTYNFGGGGS